MTGDRPSTSDIARSEAWDTVNGFYFDRDGKALTLRQWVEHTEDLAYLRVDRTVIGDVVVSTVWLGVNTDLHGEAPRIFETMVFGGEYSEQSWETSTEADARLLHDAVVTAVRDLTPLPGQEQP